VHRPFGYDFRLIPYSPCGEYPVCRITPRIPSMLHEEMFMDWNSAAVRNTVTLYKGEMDMLPKHQALPRQSGIEQQIDMLASIRMSEIDRRIAEEYLRKGELIAEFISRASKTVRSPAELVGGFFARGDARGAQVR
jgi:hypothetical protein